MKNQYKVTKNLMISWAKGLHLDLLRNAILFIAWCAIGLYGLAMLILLAKNGGEWKIWCLYILLLCLAVYKAFVSPLVAALNRYEKLAASYGVGEWIRTIEFKEQDIVFTDHQSVTVFRYDHIKKIKEKNNTVSILLQNNTLLVLYKDAFVDSTWEECKDFLDVKSKQ